MAVELVDVECFYLGSNVLGAAVFTASVNVLMLLTYVFVKLTAFGKGKKSHLLKYVCTFNAVGCVLCGTVVVLNEMLESSCFDGGVNVWVLLLSAVLVCIGFVFFGGTVAKEKSICKVDVKLGYNGKERVLSLMCDSGNLLTDPYSALPVIILKNENSPDNDIASDFVRNKTRFIPVKTADGNGIIKAIKPEYVRLIDGKEEKQINAVIGFSQNQSADFGGTDGIIPYCLIENI